MVDADIVSESAYFKLDVRAKKGIGMYVGRLQIDDTETLKTPFKKIRGAFACTIGDIDATWAAVGIASHVANSEAGVTIVFSIGEIDTYGAQAGDSYYVIVVGENTVGTT